MIDYVILEVRGLRKWFPIAQGIAAAHGRRRCARWTECRSHPPRRDAGAGRRIRLRQDHGGALHPARATADRGQRPVSRGGTAVDLATL